ncbi:MAG TPA: hypothetical protein VK582_14830 [Pyrinomonadaceae bacterium]|nr:hypothetical protein [Pyrinomonadaceae bacterium]
MSKRLIGVLGATLLLLSLAVVIVGQTPTTTVTKTIQNPDGTYTIVEYPVGKETIVTLNPVGLTGATGTATILRAADGTTIKVNLTKLPAEATAVNLYAVDPTGAVTLLGPVEIANGAAAFTTSTPLTKFMLVASPDANLSTYSDTSLVYFRSAVPNGFAVIPLSNAAGETVAAVAAPVTAPVTETAPVTATVTAPVTAPVTAVVETGLGPGVSDYAVPMIGIPTLKKGDDTKLKVNFSGAMEGARANIFIHPHKHGKMTEVLMRFHDLREAPKGQSYVLWAVSPDHQFQRLGAIVNVHGRNEAEIESETAFDDFGLLVTTEDLNPQKTIIGPAGQRVGVIQIVP